MANLLPGFAMMASLAPVQAQDFVLQEHLGRNWNRELVTFPLTPVQLEAFKNGAAVKDSKGRISAAQLTESSGQPQVALQVTLPSSSRLTFDLVPGQVSEITDLWVEESDTALRLGNAQIGIELRKVLQANEGPIGGLRLSSGAWTSGSILAGSPTIRDYRVELLARGPVFAEALCTITFSDRGTWSVLVRVENEEPVVLITEAFDAPGGGGMLVPLGSDEFKPSHLLYRKGKGQLGQLDSWPIRDDDGDEASFSVSSWLRGWMEFGKGRWIVAPTMGEAFTLEPWLRWWLNERQGNWFGVYTPPDSPGADTGGDLLMVGALKPSRWKDPQWAGKAGQVEPVVPAEVEQGVVVLQMPLGGGARYWMFGTPGLAESLAPLASSKVKTTPLPQRYLVKHGDFPLDEVKNYVLEWPADGHAYPRLFFGTEELAALKHGLEADPAEVERWATRQPIDKYNIESPLVAWFGSGDAALGQAIVNRSQEWLALAVDDDLLDQSSRVTLGVAPHNQSVQLLPTLNLTDAALGCECLDADQRRLMLARIAFLAYSLNREDYWSPERGFEANPNMTTTVALFRTALAALIPSHPLAREWAENGLGELRRELYEWSDEDGGWLEAPHYAMVSFDHILGGFLMAKNAGFGDDLYDERARKVIEWLAKISTPPDWRIGGFRHFPPIGNTYIGETTGMFGIVAGLWRERDPDFAGHMQWMSDQHGRPEIGLLGPFGTFTGYQSLLRESGIKPVKPSWGSEWFRDTGVVLRHDFGTDRETYLHLIAGSQHEHYDYDSGSIVLWARGSLFANDFGYIGRHPAQWHNLLTSSTIADGAPMQIEAFSTTNSVDYVRGRKGPWVRQIALHKDSNSMAPVVFMLRDTYDASAEANWRLWLTSEGISICDRGAVVTGVDDVDLDIFFYEPGKLKLTTETTVQKGKGRRDDEVGPVDIEQTALVAMLKGPGAVTAVLFPRLKSEPSPRVTWLDQGKTARVETALGTQDITMPDDQ